MSSREAVLTRIALRDMEYFETNPNEICRLRKMHTFELQAGESVAKGCVVIALVIRMPMGNIVVQPLPQAPLKYWNREKSRTSPTQVMDWLFKNDPEFRQRFKETLRGVPRPQGEVIH